MDNRRPVDWLDLLFEYRSAFGQHPRTWREFSYGLASIHRTHARDSLRSVSTQLIAQVSDGTERRSWFRAQRTAADW